MSTEQSRGREPWTRETALAAFLAFYDRHGYQPVTKEATAYHGLPSWNVVKRLFGSWNAAIEACGWQPYASRSSANAKQQAWRDRHSDWRERLAARLTA